VSQSENKILPTLLKLQGKKLHSQTREDVFSVLKFFQKEPTYLATIISRNLRKGLQKLSKCTAFPSSKLKNKRCSMSLVNVHLRPPDKRKRTIWA
jgi:hypothetical protein